MIGVNPNKFKNIKIIYSVFYMGAWIFLYKMGAHTFPMIILITPILIVIGQLRSMLNKANKGSFLHEVKYGSINGKYITMGVLVGVGLIFLKYLLIKYGVISYNDEFMVYIGIIFLVMVIISFGIKHVHLKFYEKGVVYDNIAFYSWDEVEFTKDKDIMKLKIKDSLEEILIKNNYYFKLDEILGYYESWHNQNV